MKLKAVLTLDSSQYEQGVTQAQASGTKVGGGLATGMKVAGMALGAAAVATTAFAVESVKAGAKFDSAMSQVAATMGTTVDEIQDLRDYAIEMGSKTAFSATESAEALNYMALAGYDAETSMAMLPNVLNLAAAGGMELATASDMITDTQSALGLSIEETTAIVDKMAKASSKSNTSVEQLGSAMLTVGGTAKMMKGGTTELAAALGVLADNGTKGSEGGTALRNILTSISGAKFEKTFGAMGVEAYDAEGNMRSLKDILVDMNGVMDGMTQEEKTNLINKTFNARDLKNVNALLATSTDRWDELTGAIDDSQGAAEQMAETQLDNLEGDITLFKSALEGVQIALSDKLTPAIRQFVQFGTDGLSLLTDLLTNGFGSENVVSTFESLPEQISSALDTGFEMANNVLYNSVEKLFMFNWKEIFDKAFAGAGALFTKVFEAALQFETLKTNLLRGIMGVGGKMIMQLVDSIAENAPELVSSAVEVLYSFITGIIDNATMLVESATTIIDTLVDYLSNNSDKIMQGAVSMVVALARGIATNAPKVTVAILKLSAAIVKGILKIVPKLPPLAVKMIASLARALAGGAGKIGASARKLAAKAIDKLKEGFNKAKDIGGNLVKGIGEGITSGTRWIKNKIRGWVGNVKEFIKHLFGINSPSKWARDVIGEGIDEGMALGIRQNTDMIDNALKSTIPDIDKLGFTTNIKGTGRSIKMINLTNNNNLTVSGAEDPEKWGVAFADAFEMKVRAI